MGEGTMTGTRQRDSAVDRLLVTHVALEHVVRRVGVQVEAHDTRAARAEHLRGGRADSRRRAGDDHALAHAATGTRAGACSRL